MSSGEINQREWSDPKNWAGGIYRSRTDSRALVPKRRGFGVTVNFGHRNGVILFATLLALPLVVLFVLYFSGVHLGRH
jgi:uncharacterized membrane protein